LIHGWTDNPPFTIALSKFFDNCFVVSAAPIIGTHLRDRRIRYTNPWTKCDRSREFAM